MSGNPRRVLVTGGAGYLGRLVVGRLVQVPQAYAVTAFDVREVSCAARLPGVEYAVCDVRSAELTSLLARRRPHSVVHLASIVDSAGPRRRAFEYSVDVGGTENVLRACLAAEVEQLVVTSSGAAYGYHADNAVPLTEDCPLRGNPEFAYADHKRQVEELLARYRTSHPTLRQLVFRPGTILGSTTDNPITRLLRGRRVWGLRGCETPFVLIWDHDVAECIVQGIERQAAGIYNLAGDGTLSLADMARLLGRPYMAVPVPWFKWALRLLAALRLSAHGPERLLFLEYRPVLSNAKLKAEFGYTPKKTTREVFDLFLTEERRRGH